MKAIFLNMAVLAILGTACTNALYEKTQLIGSWYEIPTDDSRYVQGFNLEENGTASSIGTATLKYDKWQLHEGKAIILCGESIGNGQTITFADTMDIISLNNDTLVLGHGDSWRAKYTKSNMIGGTDASAGYTFSTVLNKKIRIFETGTRVHSATDRMTSYAGYLVFAEDSAKVEVFLPEATIVLDRRTRPDGSHIWNVEDDDTYSVLFCGQEWLVTRRGEVLYSSKGFESIIEAEFKNEEGKNILVKFFTSAGIAQISANGISQILTQYVTASGYGYKNPFADIRGKGSEMTYTDLTTNHSEKFVEVKSEKSML